MPATMTEPRRIALFGGTFDPVHLGHLHLAATARAAFALDEVRFIPCRISPHKLDTVPTPATDRLAMLRLATEGLPWAVVDDLETRREGPSFSWQTADAIRAACPEARLFWIMGVDQWKVLLTWAEPQRLASRVEFIVFSRGEPPRPRAGFTLHPLACDHPASATRIREDFAAGAGGSPWLHSEVARYISRHRLYRPEIREVLED